MGRISTRQHQTGQLSKLAQGALAEDQALAFLRQQGLRLMERNFRCQLGEIDLIMRDGPQTVFVEVKFRSQTRYGEAIATVTHSKQCKIIKAATVYLQKKGWFDKKSCRFDVVALEHNPDQPKIQWIKNAFLAF